MERGVQRWAVDISEWNPSPHDFSSALTLLPRHEYSSILRYWSLKEAYVKAIGCGMASGVEQVEFCHIGWNEILAKVGGEILKEWRFWISELGNGHCVAVAKGHPRFATESYRRTLTRPEFDSNEYRAGLLLPDVSFVSKTVEQLISISME